jgi:hypothetical protein
MIVASANAAGATVFYSNDEQCVELANLCSMQGRTLPAHDEYLFDMDEVDGSNP